MSASPVDTTNSLSISLNVPSIISFFLLGSVNGLVTGGILGMSGGVSASAGGGTLILASVAVVFFLGFMARMVLLGH